MSRPARDFITRLAEWLSALAPTLSAPRHSGRCGCPLCSHSERRVRAKIGMPLRHPERITRELPAKQEALLGLLADELWPGCEYVAIITGNDGEQM